MVDRIGQAIGRAPRSVTIGGCDGARSGPATAPIAVVMGALGMALVATLVSPPAPRLVWNASASAPIGLYSVSSGVAPRRGDYVVARLPHGLRDLAARRRYLPANVPLVKRVAGLAGDRVCAIGTTVTINGRPAARRFSHDGMGRPMPRWSGCVRLGRDELLLLMVSSSRSFDGRYFGPLRRDAIVGRATLVWRR